MDFGNEPRRVWIVDDSPLDAERARRVLASAYEVEVLRDGSAALERLTSEAPPDVMVLDWVMPGISGVEVCRFLRSQPKVHEQMGIVLLTAHRAVEQIVEGLSAGANDYLSKPYEDEELKARVMSQMRARELLERATRAEDINRQLLESAPDAMIAMDARGHLTFANQEACRVFDAPKDALLGRSVLELVPALPNLPHQPSSDSYRTLADVEIGGRLFSPTVRLPPTPSSAVVTISLRDVTARREIEARRLDFYSIIAHDLRSPLNAIALRTHLILNGKHGPLSRGLAEDVHKIDASVQSLVVMINDFLEMASTDGSAIKLDHGEVDLGSLLESTMDAFRPLLEGGGLTWERSAPDSTVDCAVVGDVKRLSQVFTNLLGNAIKFTPSRGVITTTIQRVGASIEIIIADTGPGVAPDALPTLFDRYTRARGSGPDVAGSGLGLMIVREIVQAHGGSVGVDSRMGEGSRFWVRLPGSKGVPSLLPG
jgi:two-component system phosphate regulon sensor histidine kinase PhoR